MVINSNSSALTAASNLQKSEALVSKSLARLSSGSKIVNPGDDAAGLAVATRLDAQIKRINSARANVGNAVSFMQTQDGYLKKISKALDRMGELSIMAQDVTKTDNDRALYHLEYLTLKAYITESASKQFNGVPLFSGQALEVTTDGDGATFSMAGVDLANAVYTAAANAEIDTAAKAKDALGKIQTAINQVSQDRAAIGADLSRLNYTADQLTVSKENLTAASSRIQDVDVAEESTEFARVNILVQSGTAMLAQANSLPQSVLKLIQQ